MINLTSVKAAELVYSFLLDNNLTSNAFLLEHDLVHALIGASTNLADELLVTSIEQGGVLPYSMCLELRDEVNRINSTEFTFNEEDYGLLQDKYNVCPITYKDVMTLTLCPKWWKDYIDELEYLLNPDMIF
jgi:hypothetical protein